MIKTQCDLHLKFRLEFRLENSNQVDIEKSDTFPGTFVAFCSLTFFLLTSFFMVRVMMYQGPVAPWGWDVGSSGGFPGAGRAGPHSRGLSHRPGQAAGQAGGHWGSPCPRHLSWPQAETGPGCQPAGRLGLAGPMAGLGKAVGSWGRV